MGGARSLYVPSPPTPTFSCPNHTYIDYSTTSPRSGLSTRLHTDTHSSTPQLRAGRGSAAAPPDPILYAYIQLDYTLSGEEGLLGDSIAD